MVSWTGASEGIFACFLDLSHRRPRGIVFHFFLQIFSTGVVSLDSSQKCRNLFADGLVKLFQPVSIQLDNRLTA